MSWREDLRRVAIGGRELIGASFRGVPFFVETGDRTGGRRAVVHEFPYRDDPFVEDLGRKARPFRIEGYVVGDDYMAQRDALLDALENVAGTGELVHPSYGVLRVVCLNATVRESKTEGGIATFAIDFIETPTQAPVPTEVVDATDEVSASADTALLAVESEFVEDFDHTGLPSFGLDSAEMAIERAAAELGAKLAPVVSTTQEFALLTGRVALLTAQASALVRQPADVFDGFRSALAELAETVAAAPGAVMDALFEAYDVDLGPLVVATTATRTRELANQLTMQAALRRFFAIEGARLAPRVSYASIEEATAARDRVAEILDEQAGGAGDTAYPAIVSLRSEVLRAVPGGTAFAAVVTVTRNVPVPSLLLAYQLHGAVDRELDLIARNGIRHPGFVAGELKVLSDD